MGQQGTGPATADERPQHRVYIGAALAVARDPITVGEFGAFAAATGYRSDDRCESYTRSPGEHPHRSWRAPGFVQTQDDPVVCINWSDAQRYLAWLSQRTGHSYRLLTEPQYEYATRAGTTSQWWWGDEAGVGHAHCADCTATPNGIGTAPVDGVAANAFGLSDMSGHAWTWVQDCWTPDYSGAPADGSAVLRGDCSSRVLRGGSWFFDARAARSAMRYWIATTYRFNDVGVRVARAP